MREFSLRAIILGIVVGALLAAANAFVGLKVGMTISASIPAAVVSLLVMRKLLRSGTLLESNMVQTVGSAGESAAAGMIFTLPALFMLGAKDPEYLSMVIWAGIGGLLGVCFMVPLRQVLIVREHGTLPFPEGVACAEVLESGERGGSGARFVIWGAIVGAFFYLIALLGLWVENSRVAIRQLRTEAQLDAHPALLGVGYILGARVAGYMLAGAVFSWFILIPAMAFFGDPATAPLFPEKEKVIGQMAPGDFYKSYVRYIGAGAVAIGGLIALFKSMGTIGGSIWHVVKGMFSFRRGPRPNTEKDFPFPLLVLIIAGLGYAMWHLPQVNVGHVGMVAVLVFSFFFVTVSSRLVGIVGSSSNPISGMTIATLLGTALVYKYFVMDRAGDISDDDLLNLKITVLSVAAIVAIAISISGDTSQDLKTGFLVKATPYKQQTGEMIGVFTSVLVVAGVIILLNKTNGFEVSDATPNPLPAYQANIMKLLTDGVLGGQVPWTLIIIGGAGAVMIELLGLPALPFAVGMYLPLGLSTPIMIGGLIAWWVQRKRKTKTEHDPGVLTASGLVAGQGLIGVALAGVTALITWWWNDPQWTNWTTGQAEPVAPRHFGPWIMDRFEFIPRRWGLSEAWWDALPMLAFIPLALWLWRCARKRPTLSLPPDTSSFSAPPSPRPKPAPSGSTPIKAPPTVEPPTAAKTQPTEQVDLPPARVEPEGSRWAPPTHDLEKPTDPYAPPPDIGVGAPGEVADSTAVEDEDQPSTHESPADETSHTGSTISEPDNIDEAIKRARERLDGLRGTQDGSIHGESPSESNSESAGSDMDESDESKPPGT